MPVQEQLLGTSGLREGIGGPEGVAPCPKCNAIFLLDSHTHCHTGSSSPNEVSWGPLCPRGARGSAGHDAHSSQDKKVRARPGSSLGPGSELSAAFQKPSSGLPLQSRRRFHMDGPGLVFRCFSTCPSFLLFCFSDHPAVSRRGWRAAGSWRPERALLRRRRSAGRVPALQVFGERRAPPKPVSTQDSEMREPPAGLRASPAGP